MWGTLYLPNPRCAKIRLFLSGYENLMFPLAFNLA